MTLNRFPGYATVTPSVSHRNDLARLHPGSHALLAAPLRTRGPAAQWSLPVLPVHHTCAPSKKAGSFALFPVRVHLLGRKLLCLVYQPAAL